MRHVTLPDGEEVPALGQGTWYMGERRDRRAAEVAALRRGVDLGMTLIDTAEMYAEGGAEEVVGEAVAACRDTVFLVSKVYPYNASRRGVQEACARSLKRLQTERIDLYLLHWPGSIPLEETVSGFETLIEKGMIARWGVSNFDADAMRSLLHVAGGEACATDQVLYNVGRRGIEFDLLPFLRERTMPLMAYSPIEQGRLPPGDVLDEIGRRHGCDRFAVALAWLLRHPDVIAIPKAVRREHVEANRRAADLTLEPADLEAIDRAFPPPARKQPLAML
ncbi:MAG: aldo/keto reductase [Geminicoccaceae bacterium]|nr:aldo/keto reductase [Geminicoccaceae bacterium]